MIIAVITNLPPPSILFLWFLFFSFQLLFLKFALHLMEQQRTLSGSSQSPRSPSSQPFLSVSVTDPVKLGNGVQAYISYRVITNVISQISAYLCFKTKKNKLSYWIRVRVLFWISCLLLLSYLCFFVVHAGFESRIIKKRYLVWSSLIFIETQWKSFQNWIWLMQ